jgi:hypothetical protein
MTALNQRTIGRCLVDLQKLGLIGSHPSRHKCPAWIVRLAALETLSPTPRPAVDLTLLDRMTDLAVKAGSATTLALVLSALTLRRRAPETMPERAARAGLKETAARKARDAAVARGLVIEARTNGGRGKGGLVLPGPAVTSSRETLRLCPVNPASVSAKPCASVTLTEEEQETLTEGRSAPRPPEGRQSPISGKEEGLRSGQGPQPPAPNLDAGAEKRARSGPKRIQPAQVPTDSAAAALIDELERTRQTIDVLRQWAEVGGQLRPGIIDVLDHRASVAIGDPALSTATALAATPANLALWKSVEAAKAVALQKPIPPAAQRNLEHV